MADIAVRKGGGPPASSHPSRAWDPIHLMQDFMRWDPFRALSTGYFPDEPSMLGFAPDFEVKETKGDYVFRADVPGIKEQDLEVTLTGTRLSVSGRRETEKSEESETYFASERSYGSFARSFTLPEGIDGEHLRADLKDGVLTLVVPKKPEVQAKRIEVKASESTSSSKGAKA